MPRKAAQEALQATQQGGVLLAPCQVAPTPEKPKFRLSSPRAKESALQAQICQWLRAEQARGRVVWFCRVNGGLAQYGRQRIRNYVLHLRGAAPVGKGYADLHGMLPGGRYFALEVKRPGETATDEQAAFIRAVQRGGGIAEVVTSFDEVAAFFRAHKKPAEAGLCAGAEPAKPPEFRAMLAKLQGKPLEPQNAP